MSKRIAAFLLTPLIGFQAQAAVIGCQLHDDGFEEYALCPTNIPRLNSAPDLQAIDFGSYASLPTEPGTYRFTFTFDQPYDFQYRVVGFVESVWQDFDPDGQSRFADEPFNGPFRGERYFGNEGSVESIGDSLPANTSSFSHVITVPPLRRVDFAPRQLPFQGGGTTVYYPYPATHTVYGTVIHDFAVRGWGPDQTPSFTFSVDKIGSVPVPEAPTWAMMIGGFGLAGAALRKRPGNEQRPA